MNNLDVVAIFLFLPVLLLVILKFRAAYFNSKAKTVMEVIARLLISVGCIGRGLDQAIVVYRREKQVLHLASERQRERLQLAKVREIYRTHAREKEEGKQIAVVANWRGILRAKD